MQRALSHLLECAHFARITLAREVDLAVAALTDLGDDVELVYAQLGTSFTQNDAFAAAVRSELALELGVRGCELAGGEISIKSSAPFFARRVIAKKIEVVIKKVYEDAVLAWGER